MRLNKHAIVLIAIVFAVFLVSQTAPAQIPSTLGWHQVPNSKLAGVAINYPQSKNVVTAWGGGVFDTLRNRMIVWGGGHNDYSGNEIYAVNMNATPSPVRLTNNTNPSGCSMGSCDGGVTPNSRHTYDNFDYSLADDIMFVYSGGLAGYGNWAQDAWAFHFSTSRWEYLNPISSGPLPVASAAQVSVSYDPVTRKFWLCDAKSIYTYDYSTKTFTGLYVRTSGFAAYPGGVIDPVRRKLFIIDEASSAQSMWVVDMTGADGYTPRKITMTGAETGFRYTLGMAYDPVSGDIVGWRGGDTVYRLNTSTYVVTAVTGYTGGPGVSQPNGTYGRWNYSPTLGAFVVVNSFDQDVFTFRLNNGTPPPVDSQAPTVPTNLTAVPAAPSQINLSSTPSTDNVAVAGYMVERCQGSSCNTFAQVGLPFSPSYSDTGLAASTTYSYRIRATDAAGNLSAYSSVISATTAAAPPPPPPLAGAVTLVDFGANSSGNTFGLSGWSTVIKDGYTDYQNLGPGGTAIVLGENYAYNYQGVMGSAARGFASGEKIVVTWYNNSGSSITFTPNVSFTDPDRIISGAVGTWYAMTPTTVPGFGAAISEYAFTPSTAGSYSLVNVNGNYTNNAVLVADKIELLPATTVSDTQSPSVPSSLAATASSSSQISISWAPSTDNIGVSGYRVERCQGTSCSTFTQIAFPSSTSFSDSGLTASTTYNYRLRASDISGNLSSYSSIATATTSAPPAPTGTLKVGPGKQYATIAAAVAAASAGNIIEIDAGIYPNESMTISQSSLTLRGVGGSAHLRWGTGNYLTNTSTIPNGKGMLVISGNDVTLENLEFSGAKVVDENGAGIRYEGGNLTIRNSYFHDNENGILGQGGLSNTLLIEYSTFERNGYCPSACTHNLYIGHMGTLIFRYNKSFNSHDGHALKSRARVNEIVANYLSTKTGDGSYEAEFPNGGTVYLIGNVIEQGANTGNSTMVGWGFEGASNPNPALYVVNNTFYNWRTNGANFVQVSGSPTLSIKNNIFAGGGTSLVGGTTDLSSNMSLSSSAFVNAASGDFHLASGAAAINSGVAPGSAGAYDLTPLWEYVEPAGKQGRALVGTIDVGAYESGSTGAGPTDTVPPVIMNAAASNISSSGATITWITSEAADGQVEYGLTASYGSQTSINSSLVTSHSLSLSGLSGLTTYNFRVKSRDAAGNLGVSTNVTLTTSATAPAPGDATPPSVTFSAPANGATVSGSSVTVSANASDNVGVAGVQFRLDGTNLGAEDTSAPYSIVWSTTSVSNGVHSLTAVARDAAGNLATSAARSVTVSNTVPDTTLPVISLSAPSNGATVSGSSVTVSANASDNVGVAGVQFRLDGANLGAEDTSAPYSVIWNTTSASNGSHTLAAVARDAAGNITTSAVISVTKNISNVTDFVPPVVSLTAPTTDGTVSGTSVTVSANASDNVGVAGVQFLLDGANLGAETSSPHSIVWNTTAASDGSHSLAAVARDNTGNLTRSAPITVNIKNNATSDRRGNGKGRGRNSGGTPPEPSNSSAETYAIAGGGVQSWTNSDTSTALQTGYATVQTTPQTAGSTGFLFYGLRIGSTLVSEVAVPASAPMQSGMVDVDINGPVNTGFAIANGNDLENEISFFFTKADGTQFGHGTFIMPPDGQLSAFLNDSPFQAPSSFQGTFTFRSSLPISAICLRGYTNERGEFLMTTVPVFPTTAQVADKVVFPLFVDGGGWSSELVLTNPTTSVLTGSLRFLSQGSLTEGASPMYMALLNGHGDSTFNYSIPAGGASRFVTANNGATMTTGSVLVTPNGPVAPHGSATLSFQKDGITVARTGVTASPMGAAFRIYVETSGVPGQAGSIQTGLAVSNPSAAPVRLDLRLNQVDGTTMGVTSLDVPAGGSVARFLNELLPTGAAPFQGVLELTSGTPVAVMALRGRYNERGDFLFATTPAINVSHTPSTPSSMIFPHIVSGGGFTSELVIFSSTYGSTVGEMMLHSPSGSSVSWNLTPAP